MSAFCAALSLHFDFSPRDAGVDSVRENACFLQGPKSVMFATSLNCCDGGEAAMQG